jgi:UDP-N-acetylmuramoyl-L-alanyl-D-glutamate--2,6-diaminopimelate ligase
MRLNELIGGQARVVQPGIGLETIHISGLASDSRAVRQGNLFVALPGAKADGASFIPQAIEGGAVAILVPAGKHPPVPAHIALVEADEPRQALARLAARFFGRQPKIIAAVTGTSGKTSTSVFTRQIWSLLGHPAASLGTIGLIGPGIQRPESLTTPDPIELHRLLADLAERDIDHLAMEASSHGLDQFRLDGVAITAAAFTNLSRDHLDYHGDMVTYLAAKLRLFSELLPPGGTAIVNADMPEAAQVIDIARRRRHRLVTFGRKGGEIRLLRQKPMPAGQEIDIEIMGQRRQLAFPVVGLFQAENLLAALGLVIGSGEEVEKTLAMVERLTGIQGRIERVAQTSGGAAIYVDYAHKPAGLEAVLQALRPHVGGRLCLVFGCGGDRDRGKRPEMGAIAMRLADRVIVTDDNPRSENPAAIRAAILAAAPGATEIGDRAHAIRAAIGELKPGDLLVIAGKGHETYQIVGDKKLPFDDGAVARACVAELARGAA